jgi:putative addiction module component (TIGR02574 family)
MSEDARHLLEGALRLPLDERSQLAERLLRSLEDEEASLPPEEWERLWSEEITRRLREIDEGRTQLVDGDNALARARAVLKPRR